MKPAARASTVTQGRPAMHKASCSNVSGSELIYQFTAPTTDTYTVLLSAFSGAR